MFSLHCSCRYLVFTGPCNITADNTDMSTTYSGFWEVTTLGGYDFNGTQNLIVRFHRPVLFHICCWCNVELISFQLSRHCGVLHVTVAAIQC
jgi:hypothetical protein